MNVTDLFDRIDNTDLGATWTVQRSGFNSNGQIINQVVYASADNREACEQYSDDTPTDPQFSETTAVNFGSTTQHQMQGPCTRMTTPGSTAADIDLYRATLLRNDEYYGGKTTILFEVTNNSETVLASEAATTWANTDVLRLESVGNAHNVYRNGSGTPLLTDADDNAHTSGKVGLYIYTESYQENSIETWSGGDVAAGGPVYEQTNFRFRTDTGGLQTP